MRFSMRTRVKSRERNGTKPRKKRDSYCSPNLGARVNPTSASAKHLKRRKSCHHCHLLPPAWRLILCSPGDRRGVSKKLPPTATYCHFLARWEHSLNTLGALAQEAQIPAWPGFTIVQAASAAVYQRNGIVPSRTQHRLASAEPGGTWLLRLCGTVQEEGTVRVG